MSKNNNTGSASNVLKFYIGENDDCHLLGDNESFFEDTTILNNENDDLESNENMITTKNLENKDSQNIEKEKEYSVAENNSKIVNRMNNNSK